MPIDYDALIATSVDDEPCAYDEHRCLLYALGVGFAADPTDRHELPYAYEGASLRTVPTMAGALLSPSFVSGCGWDYSMVLHSEERLDLYRPLPPSAELLVNRRVTAVQDLGEERGARIVMESEARLAKDDTVLFTAGRTLIARADGGFDGPSEGGPSPHALPDREPDLTCELTTRADQALLFRLSGDFNPLYADPALARRVGFERPILHPLCIYGIACRAVLRTICGYDFTLICGFDARFAGPVYPGDQLVTEMWQDRNIVSFRCVVPSRGAVVVDNGKCTLVG